MWSGERLARAGLCSLMCHADADLGSLVAEHGAEQVWAGLIASERQTGLAGRSKRVGLSALAEATSASGSRFVIPGDDEWPREVDALATSGCVGGMGGPPFGLWLRGPGELPEWLGAAVALVGSRACSDYGTMAATDLAYELAADGWTIVSGGAYGIDAAAHRAALNAGGRTIAVLANGIDLAYPRGNAALLDRVAAHGLIATELPPGAGPTRPGFLARNRLIAAFAAGTVVVEASARSGARNTANWASSLGRSLMAVPGSIASAGSVTPHRLIRDGEATLVASLPDVAAVLAPVGCGPQLATGGEPRPLDSLSATELAVRECLPARGTRSAGEISLLTGIDMPTCLATLGQLSAKCWVQVTEDGSWKLDRPSA